MPGARRFLALLFALVPAVAARPPIARGADRPAAALPPHTVDLATRPPASPTRRALLQQTHRRRPLPPSPPHAAVRVVPQVPESGVRLGPRAAGDFVVIRDTDLRSSLPASDTSVIGEPCVAKSGRDVFMVGNWYAAMSIDAGATFQFVSPETSFPIVNNGFCCDQNALYDPSHQLFFWLLMYAEDGTSNTLRIAVARGAAAFEARQWTYYDVRPQDLGFTPGHWLDYPQAALGTNALYVSANVFQTGSNGPFVRSVIFRLGLDAIAAGGAAVPEVYPAGDDHFTFTPLQGAGTTMYWASNDAATSTVRLYSWAEGAPPSAVGFGDVSVRTWGQVNPFVCAGPDGRSWCARNDDRVMSGWVAGGVVGIMWNSSQDTGHPYPYVRVARIALGSGALIDEPDMTNAGYAVQLPSVGVNARGHIAGSVFLGGGALYPSVAAFILDDLAGPVPPWELHILASGNSGPAMADQWGDFVCTRPDAPNANTWIMTGYVLRDGGVEVNVHPHFFGVGRERDVVCNDSEPCPDDGNPCTGDVCTNGTCTHPPQPDGLSCDNDACALGGTCSGGVCVGATPRNCADDDPCTADTCDAAIGCQNQPLGGYTGLLCVFHRGLDLPACQAIPPTVQRRFAGASRLAERAQVTVKPRRQRQFLSASTRRLQRARSSAARAEARARVSDGCFQALDARLATLQARANDVLGQI